MKCEKCGFDNKDNAKFCTKCGNSLARKPPVASPANTSNNSKYIILALVAIIIILVAAIGYFALNMQSGNVEANDNAQDNGSEVAEASLVGESESSPKTAQIASTSQSSPASTQLVESKSWESIGSYSGSGSGSQTISVPEGQIMVKLSAFPIKNYATNHLYVTGSNGQSGGVDWGPTSDVETRSDSFEYTSSSSETFTIDYNETVSWEVEFFRYQ